MKSLVMIPITLMAIGSQALAEAKLWPTTIECKFSETYVDTSAETFELARKKADIQLLIEPQYSNESATSAFGQVEVEFPATKTKGFVNVLFRNRDTDGKGSAEKSLFLSFHYKIDGQFTGAFSHVERSKDTDHLVSNINMLQTPYLLQLFEFAKPLPPEEKKDQLKIYKQVFPKRKLVPISYEVNCSASETPKFKIGEGF